MSFEEKTSESNCLYKGKIINLKRDGVILPDGKNAVREYVEHSGGASVLCLKDGKVLMVKQFRYPYREEIWEIPAGKRNEGETFEQTALRELEEEGGVRARKIKKIFEIYPTPAYTNEIIRIFYAWDLVETKVHLDEDEFLRSEWMSKDRLKSMINSGEIKDAKTLIALLYLFADGENGEF